jgi:hypothetical protein
MDNESEARYGSFEVVVRVEDISTITPRTSDCRELTDIIKSPPFVIFVVFLVILDFFLLYCVYTQSGLEIKRSS